MAGYNDTFDADQQITLEERIAARIFQQGEETNPEEQDGWPRPLGEEDCADLGRDILLMIVEELRPDLIE